MFTYANSNYITLLLQNLTGCYYPIEMINAILDKDIINIMKYRLPVKNAKYHKLYGQSYTKKLCWLAQVIQVR